MKFSNYHFLEMKRWKNGLCCRLTFVVTGRMWIAFQSLFTAVLDLLVLHSDRSEFTFRCRTCIPPSSSDAHKNAEARTQGKVRGTDRGGFCTQLLPFSGHSRS